jgi:ferredoxin
MIAMAHRLFALGKEFELHYSCSSREGAGFLDDLATVPWLKNVHLHFSNEGSRADLASVLAFRENSHVYTCGPESYMASVMEAAQANGFPEDSRHLEYFAVPETPEYINNPFTLELRDGRKINVASDESASDALINAGIHVDLKCSDGLCGVCKCGVTAGAIEHRDFVLSKSDQASNIILCQSRAAEKNGVISIDLG